MLTLEKITKTFRWPHDLRRCQLGHAGRRPGRTCGTQRRRQIDPVTIIAEIVPPDGGRISRPQRTRVGYLHQDSPEWAAVRCSTKRSPH